MKLKFTSRLGVCLSVVVCLFIAISFITRATPVEAQSNGFVQTCGTLFCLNGKVFNVAGTNNHYLGWGTQYEVDQFFADAKAMNVNVVRGILHSVRGSLDSNNVNQGSMPLKWNWGSTADSSNMGMKGVYILYWDANAQRMAWNDSTTNGLGRWDYVIWKAKQLDLKLNISLLDFWQWAGGVQQINANFKGGNYDIANAADRYTFFFEDARTKAFYKEWVSHVLNRTNTLTGIKYKDDPTIFAWDLMNEPEIAGTQLGRAWISEMSAHVKSIDPNHLVASGNEGFADGHAGSNPQLEMGISTIDFATWHTYPTYHKISVTDVTNQINAYCNIAAQGQKPVVLQEFAYPSSASDQSSIYQSWISAMHNHPNCAGWMYWRLESRQASGQYPPDNGEKFGIYNDNSTTSVVLKNAAAQFISRGSVAIVPTNAPITPMPTSTPMPIATTTLVPTILPTIVVQPTKLPESQPVPTSVRPGTPVEKFVKGINFNGNAVNILGNQWVSYAAAKGQGLTVAGAASSNTHLATNPTTDAATSHMLNSALFSSADKGTMSLTQVIPNGTYRIYLWTMENYAGNQRRWNLTAENVPLGNNLGDLGINQWKRYGGYTVVVADGKLNISMIGVVGRPMIMGLEIYSVQ
ncbi:MAG: cellulase family glycosylhydrolase [Chloroflexi bacterium]|nr:cellulase family glycosylhydrolase [Chloroflexota bacterium]MCC6895834.1 cellulase family glycosylhydrolase [Anaerolineae bacterium]